MIQPDILNCLIQNRLFEINQNSDITLNQGSYPGEGKSGPMNPVPAMKTSASVPMAGPRAAVGARDSPSRVLIVGYVFEEF